MILLLILLTIFVIALSSILNGWVLSILWGWFIVPIFHLPALSVPQAIGIAIVIGLLTAQVDNTKEEYIDNTKSILSAFIYPLIALLFGWIVKGFI